MSNSPSLKDRVLKSGGWVTGGFALSRVLRLGINLILTRLLFPKAFGLMAIVNVLILGMRLFSDMGVNLSIVQNPKGDDPEFLNTAWVFQILRGLLLFVIALLIAKMLPIAVSMHWFKADSAYDNPLLPSLLAVASLSLLIDGFESTKMGLASRKVNLERIIKIRLLAQVIALPVMVIWAWWYHSIWALVGGSVLRTSINCLLSHVWLPGTTNRFQWNKKYFIEIFHFGKYIFLLSMLGFLFDNGDRLILGDLLDPSLLGIYSIAIIFSSIPKQLYHMVSEKVLFPALSEVLKHRPENTAKVYKRVQTIADSGLFFAAGFLFVAGKQIISLLYDARYHDAGSMLSILALYLMGIRYGVVEELIMAAGKMRYLLVSKTFEIATLYAGILIGFKMNGLNGALYAIVLSYFATWPVALYYKHRHNLANWKWELLAWPVFGIGAGAGWLFEQLVVWVTG